ncbi:hypothetical protein [Kribbella albertanoniae]|uniref:hypothetical protein n=1 Tax=Kribbella albertanoniae TaxID=1266829 RepID=UPI0014046388|nr:hypothetical protein [Kribbella albertanoniae]
MEESRRERLIEVHGAAARFYRRELLRDKHASARQHLESAGVRELLDPGSHWSVGYAPDSRARLTNHLRSRGFDLATVRDAGLCLLDADGRTVDRFRNQLMLPARNYRLQITGFVGVREGDKSPYYTATLDTLIHTRSSSLLGLAEQLDLLDGEATPILVNDPMDALAIERLSRLSGGRWVGIPLCNMPLSGQQATMLGVRTLTDTVVVLVTDRRQARRILSECLPELAGSFRRVQAVELPSDQTPAVLAQAPDGLQRLHDALLLTRPLSDYQSHRRERSRGASPTAVSIEDQPGPCL